MAEFKYDENDTEVGGTQAPIGEYDVKITDVTYKTTKSTGNDMLVFDFEVLPNDEDIQGAIRFFNLVFTEKNQKRINRFIKAIGGISQGTTLNPQDESFVNWFIGKELHVKTIAQTSLDGRYTNPSVDDYEVKNGVFKVADTKPASDFDPFKELDATAVDDDNPF